jgi:type IX secretion system PorP/SprF family membrane protein
VGLSAQQIVPVPINSTSGTTGAGGVELETGKLIPHTFLTAGYKILVSENINVMPSVMFRYVQPLPIGFDLNAKIQYQDLLWLGFSYRYEGGFAAMFGVNISSTVNLGYAYDYSTTQLNTVSKGTQELVIGFLWRKNKNNVHSK